MVLTIAASDIKRLCGILDTSQDAVLTALLLAEQPAAEYALDPGLLARVVVAGTDAGALSTLTLGVSEMLAGSYLASLGRFPHFAEPLPLAAFNAQPVAVLTVALADIKRLLSVSDSSQDAALTALITAEQLAREYALDPAVLAAAGSALVPNAGLKALLTLGIAEQIAGSALSEAGRVPGIADDVQISSLHFTTSHGASPDKLGAELSAQGTGRLAPFSRHIRAEHALKPVLNQPELLKIGAALTAQGEARLAPYRRAKRSAAVQAIGPAPDDYANLVKPSASSVLPGAEAGVSQSVFIGAFSDAGDSFTQTLNADGLGNTSLDADRAETAGLILWGS